MYKLTLPADAYTTDGSSFKIVRPRLIGIYELLWLSVTTSPLQDLDKKELKLISRLKRQLTDIGEWKDNDRDARVLQDQDAEVYLETDEFDMMVRLIESQKFSVRVADEVTELWNIIDKASIVSPKLVAGSNEP